MLAFAADAIYAEWDDYVYAYFSFTPPHALRACR